MIVSIFLSVSRRIRAWTEKRRQKRMRLNKPTSAMFISTNGKSVFKFLNK
nr:MAG TPA: hypothetical protein [Caudoviricetes sp.]